jgi:hypothetical protein
MGSKKTSFVVVIFNLRSFVNEQCQKLTYLLPLNIFGIFVELFDQKQIDIAHIVHYI